MIKTLKRRITKQSLYPLSLGFALLLFLGVFVFDAPFGSRACAQSSPAFLPAASSCDANYYDTLKSRAWLEAQRETTQNQNLILKPDTVLEYSCFTHHINQLSNVAPSLFSGQGRDGNPMEGTLDQLVRAPAQNYIGLNYPHLYLGGRAPAMRVPANAPNSNYLGDYNCDVMNRVWQVAKCMNFIDNPATDGFFNLTHYKENADKRQFADGSGACQVASGWIDQFDLAFGPERQARQSIEDWFEAKKSVIPWAQDPVDTFYEHFDPQSCGDAQYGPFPTGVVVSRLSGDPLVYNEKICTMPGCYYEPTDLNEGECVRPQS